MCRATAGHPPSDGVYALSALEDRPGFLIRRLHQIHIAIFAAECARFGVTPVQFSVMTVLLAAPALDQATIADKVGIDRANTTDVLMRLERKGLLARRANARDGRYKLCSLTVAGRGLARRMGSAIDRVHDRTVAPLPAAERKRFVASLRRLVGAART